MQRMTTVSPRKVRTSDAASCAAWRTTAVDRDRRSPAREAAGMVVTADMRVLFGHEAIVDRVEGRARNKTLDVLVTGYLLGVLEHDHERTVVLQFELKVEVHFLTLVRIALACRRIVLLGDLWNIPGIAPGQGLRLRIVRVVGIARETVGVRMRIHVVGR